MSAHMKYNPRSPSGRYTQKGGFSSPPKPSQDIDYGLISGIKPMKERNELTPMDRQRLHAMTYSNQAEEFELMFPTNVDLDDSLINEFKDQDRSEQRVWWSPTGKEEEKAVMAAKVLLEKEEHVNVDTEPVVSKIFT